MKLQKINEQLLVNQKLKEVESADLEAQIARINAEQTADKQYGTKDKWRRGLTDWKWLPINL